jgi:hypothetical protein
MIMSLTPIRSAIVLAAQTSTSALISKTTSGLLRVQVRQFLDLIGEVAGFCVGGGIVAHEPIQDCPQCCEQQQTVAGRKLEVKQQYQGK